MTELKEHNEDHVHMHVKCPACEGQSFNILVYPEVVQISCVADGESIDLSEDLVAAFVALLPEGKN